MTLLELLIAMCFFIAVEAAYMSASHLGLGFLGHALALVLGVAIGCGFAWSMWASMGKLVKFIERMPSAVQGVCGIGVVLLYAVWIIVAGFAGDELPSAILRRVF